MKADRVEVRFEIDVDWWGVVAGVKGDRVRVHGDQSIVSVVHDSDLRVSRLGHRSNQSIDGLGGNVAVVRVND